MRSHQNRKATEVDFARETRRSNLRGIPSPKSERVRRTWIPTTSLVICNSLLFVQRPAHESFAELKMLFSQTTDFERMLFKCNPSHRLRDLRFSKTILK
jgi:hypothetical protein